MKVSQDALDLVGEEVTYTSTGKGKQYDAEPVVVQDVELMLGVITRKEDGTEWSTVRFKMKPILGGRAFWTFGMPDVELGKA